jgi:tetratricopeptide (TPR) repeat protein
VAAGRRALRLAALLALLVTACALEGRDWDVARPAQDPYQTLGEEERAELRAAISALEAGRLGDAAEICGRLARSHPRDLPTAVWGQEVLVATYGRRAESGEPLAGLRERYRQEAEAEPEALAWYLAARLDGDAHASRRLLREAIAADPDMTWARYGLAHVAAAEGEWASARAELERVFERDPGHLPALRLFGWLEARTGHLDRATLALEAWLAEAHRDLLATRAVDERVRFDLALCHLAGGRSARALELCDDLEGSTVPRSLRLSARAVALQDLGRVAEARSAARAARRADRDAVLPAVQDALLLELWLRDRGGAIEAWEEVIERAARDDDLAAGLQRFRAEVHLERLGAGEDRR